jgi:superfamily II DNA or RNA helicase/HKD family nuclease
MADVMRSDGFGKPVTGLYEELITRRLAERMRQLDADGLLAIDEQVGAESSPHVLARHVGATVGRVLQDLTPEEQVAAANQILTAISTLQGAKEWISTVVEGPRQLLAIAEQKAPGVYEIHRPVTPLSETALITNSPEDPNLGFELRAELATADSIDLLCAFVKWHGLRVLEQPLMAARERGAAIRVITTTYIGATERRALDRLVRDFGAEVKVNYETRSTRLHAKAWLFRRRTGYDTAYVGSSNLSRAALLDGLEWNVRLSSVATPAVMRKFEATFDSYWSEPAFESYDPDRDGDRLSQALLAAGGSTEGGASRLTLSGLDVRPYPYQRDMLERLDAERKVHDRHRNLLVAATGTGKTVMAALDYRSLRQKLGRDLRLLFVAHRREILEQSLRTYQEVVGDANLGEALHSGDIPAGWQHVFASVQSLNTERLQQLDPRHFDVVVIDEFHHATAKTYRRIIEHFEPLELLGLTATPERMEGLNVQDEFFDGRIAAEMRLWEALENDLLSPFHYFGITDSTDLTAVTWRRTSRGYDAAELSRIFTADTARARLILRAVNDKIADPGSMRALGFCVSVEHARYMAACFQEANLAAVALSSQTPKKERRAALAGLASGELQVIFSVDLLNEGLDIPDVDTLLLLRPTSSATVFLQQLGRGLRRTEGKAVLTVLDFIGQHRAEFRFEEIFGALTDLRRTRLADSVEQDFPQLPSGCQIILERKAKERVLKNIRDRISINAPQLAQEIARYARPTLADYLNDSGRDIKQIYRGGNCWTALLRRAKLLPDDAPSGEDQLLKRTTAFHHVDDPVRINAYSRLLADDVPAYDTLDPQLQAYARMLVFSLWPSGGSFAEYGSALRSLAPHRAFRDEARQILAYNLARTEHVPVPLLGDHAGLPLTVHGSYNREEILTALGQVALGGYAPNKFQEGARWCPNIATDALFVTLEKDAKDFSPQTRYRDYAMSETRFHWESQGRTSDTSATGIRYRTHAERGTHVLLFVRRFKRTDIGGPQPWTLLGPAQFVESRGSRPMGIVWDLRHRMPADMWTHSAIAAG